MAAAVDLASIQAARRRIRDWVRRTPLLPSTTLGRLTGGEVFLKAESLQRTGSFKVRGAFNRLTALTEEERRRGVIAASAGNHAQGVALAASSLGVPCTVVMPRGASLAKIEATRGYGAAVVLHGESIEEALAHARRLSDEQRLLFVPPYDDPMVVSGQGTLGLEIAEELPDVEVVLVPVGGGGLAAGVAVAIKTLLPSVKVIGVQAEAAPGAALSWQEGAILRQMPQPTIADGIAVAGPGEVTFPLLRRYLDDLVCVDEDAITQAMVVLMERAKLVVEGAGAVGVAALLSHKVDVGGHRTAVILSGANVDITLLDRVVEHGLTQAGRYLVLSVGLDDQPGQLARLLAVIAEAGANVLSVEHQRWGIDLSVGRVRVELLLEVRNRQHAAETRDALTKIDFTPPPQPGPALDFIPRHWQGQ